MIGLVVAQGQEVRKLREAESSLRESRELYRGLVETSQDLVWRCDAEGRFTYLNPAWETTVGYSRAEMIGHSFSEFQPPEVAARDAKEFESHLAGGAITGHETQYTHKDGHEVYLIFNAIPLLGDDGTIVGTQGTAFDITARKRSEERMHHTQKLESLGVLAGGIAHDFNNLLMGVLGNADLALGEPGLPVAIQDGLEDIKQAAQRAAELCRQLLAYSGRGRFVIEMVDVSQVVEEMTHLLEVAIAKNVVLRCDLASNLPTTAVDATQLRQVVMNLITNASEAVGSGSGLVSVTTGVMDCDQSYLDGLLGGETLPPGEYVYIEVSDTGCGMDEATIAKLFDPFFTTKFTGRGLGMAAVLGIVAGHKGALRVYSEVGRGTTIKLVLPVSTTDVAIASPPPPPIELKGSGTILLVDDDETVQVVTRRMLKRMGFDVLTAGDGREALVVYKECDIVPELVLLDMTMPHMGGEETFRELRRLNSTVKVILCSGYNEQEAIQRFAGRGLAGFIQKPFTLSALRAKIHSALQR